VKMECKTKDCDRNVVRDDLCAICFGDQMTYNMDQMANDIDRWLHWG